jgi:hypothetical protein
VIHNNTRLTKYQRYILLMEFITAPDTNYLTVNIELTKVKVTAVINLKWLNLGYPSCRLVNRHLTFPVTTNVIFAVWSSHSRLRELASCIRYFVLHGFRT